MRIRIMNYHLNLAATGSPHLKSDYIKKANHLKSNYKLLLKNDILANLGSLTNLLKLINLVILLQFKTSLNNA